MIKTITEIFNEIQPPNMSMSVARKLWSLGEVAFNGEQITSMNQEVEVDNGSTFQAGKSLWKFDGVWCRHRPIEKSSEYHMKLVDHDNPDNEAICKVRQDGSGTMLMIGVEGYEEKCGDGNDFPILIELHDGELKVRLWGDINQEDPTHCISMKGAKGSARETDSTH